MIYWKRSEENRSMITEFASRFPFFKHPGFLFDPFLEGYKKYTFGAVAGPSLNMEYLCHEIAHAADFGPQNFKKRTLTNNFNFHIPEYEAVSSVPTQRESRTMGLQLRLMDLINLDYEKDVFIDSMIEALKFMPDWGLTWGERKREEAIKKLTLDTYESSHISEIIDNIVGWLDQTHEVLTRNTGENND